jgi:hypothetical protein
MERKLARGGKRSTAVSGFWGNKQALPSKPCAHCGREMTWRKAWAKNWSEVKFCSERCRREAKVAR